MLAVGEKMAPFQIPHVVAPVHDPEAMVPKSPMAWPRTNRPSTRVNANVAVLSDLPAKDRFFMGSVREKGLRV